MWCVRSYPYCESTSATYLYYHVPDVEDVVHPESSLLEAGVSPMPVNISTRMEQIVDEELNPQFLRASVTQNLNGTKPLKADACHGPCLELGATSHASCQPLSCNVTGWIKLGYPCNPRSYKPNILRDCYCHQVRRRDDVVGCCWRVLLIAGCVQEFQSRIKGLGLIVATIQFLLHKDADICKEYIDAYFWNRALPYVGMATLAFLNCFLRMIICKVVPFERQISLSGVRVSVMIKVRDVTSRHGTSLPQPACGAEWAVCCSP
jgi:hypothetical protein